MIQRIQSVYLFLAAVFMGGLFLHSADMISINTTNPSVLSNMEFLNDESFDIYDQISLVVLVSLVIVLSLLAIFLFRTRKLQINLSRATMLIVFAFLILTLYFTFGDISPYISSIKIIPNIGIFLPILVIVCLILAVRGIRKDDKLVKSMDRLR